MPWLSRQKPKAGVHSELGSASPSLPSRSQAPGPCDCSDAAPALAVRTTADGRALSGALLRRSAAATPAVRAQCSRAQPRPPGRSRREPQPPGTAAAGDHARPPPAGARSPGQALRRCFSNSDSSSRNSNQQVCGGVQGRLEVAASRSAASALILPPPPPLPAPPGSNLTPAGGLDPPPGSARNARTACTTQDGGGPAREPRPGFATRRALDQSLLEFRGKGREQEIAPPPRCHGVSLRGSSTLEGLSRSTVCSSLGK